MKKNIEINAKHVDKDKLHALTLEMSKIIGNADMIETDDGDFIIDAISEMKCDAVELKIKMELLKAGYKTDIYGDIIDNRAEERGKTSNRLSHLSLIK